MLSNRVREEHLTREQALAKAIEYGRPRFPSIRDYAQLVGFNCEEALTIIDGLPKAYGSRGRRSSPRAIGLA